MFSHETKNRLFVYQCFLIKTLLKTNRKINKSHNVDLITNKLSCRLLNCKILGKNFLLFSNVRAIHRLPLRCQVVCSLSILKIRACHFARHANEKILSSNSVQLTRYKLTNAEVARCTFIQRKTHSKRPKQTPTNKKATYSQLQHRLDTKHFFCIAISYVANHTFIFRHGVSLHLSTLGAL